ncbi:MAG TPA: thymidylate kinase, partial [Bacteroidales bacterium]|nr:thymidylate kinase [Bacteroidales bacterium]
KREELRKWILELEFNYNRIPKPDLNILLDVPFSFTQKNLKETRTGVERDYLQGTRDIHEEDLDFQQRVRDMYIWQAETSPDLRIIDCNDAEGGMRDPKSIFNSILTQTGLKF